jgi:hypothetical protein
MNFGALRDALIEDETGETQEDKNFKKFLAEKTKEAPLGKRVASAKKQGMMGGWWGNSTTQKGQQEHDRESQQDPLKRIQ